MRRILILAALAVIAFWGACTLRRSLAADETRIRWALEDAVDDFNGGRPGYAVAPLADDWRDRTSGVGRDTLHRALVGMKWQEGDTAWRLRVPPESLRIAVDGDAATTLFELELSRARGDGREVEWHVAVDAEWRDGEDGWEIARSSHATLGGRRP